MATRSIRQRLARAIRDRRDVVGITQEQAAERADLSPRYWRALESDEPPAVGLEIVEQVIEGLGWTWSDLIAVLAPGRDDDGEAPARARRLLDEAWRRATPREREAVTAILRVIASGRRPRA